MTIYRHNAAKKRKSGSVERERRQNWMIVATILTILVLLVAFFGFLLLTSGGKAVVPKVVGLTYAEAQKKANEANLDIRVSSLQDTGSVKDIDGLKVVKQDPKVGVGLFEGLVITVELEGLPYVETAKHEQEQTAPDASAESNAPAQAEAPAPAPAAAPALPALVCPVQGGLLYPFTKDASIACGHWPAGSQDYPYFGAPRDGGSRLHAGIDVYPTAGEGSPVVAMKDGSVIKVAAFYTRANGEVTYGVLINHGDFVANYAELRAPSVRPGQTVRQGQAIGQISGTLQLHFEQYSAGTTDWVHGWYGSKPANLADPTGMMLGVS